jgi:RHS repeat-associated protein
VPVTKYFYDGDQVFQEYDDAGVVQKEYSWAGPGGRLLSDYDGTSTKYFEPDALGSTDALADESQNVVDRWQYRAFGAATQALGTDITPYVWVGGQGYYNDAEIGLYQLGNGTRYYDPVTAQFLSDDPIGFAGGDSNIRRYVRNNPTGLVDPTGLEPPQGANPDDERLVRMLYKVDPNWYKCAEIWIELAKKPPWDSKKTTEGALYSHLVGLQPLVNLRCQHRGPLPTPVCEVTLHYRNVFAGELHYGLTIRSNLGLLGTLPEFDLDAGPSEGSLPGLCGIGKVEFGVNKPAGRYTKHPSISWSDPTGQLCRCLDAYVRVFNSAKKDYMIDCQNSNWALRCALESCGKKLTFADEPLGWQCKLCVEWKTTVRRAREECQCLRWADAACPKSPPVPVLVIETRVN